MNVKPFPLRAYKIQPQDHVSVPNILRTCNNLKNKFQEVKTPQSIFTVRMQKSSDSISYYLYDKKTDECVGEFMIEELDKDRDSWKEMVKPGTFVVTPHLTLSPVFSTRSLRQQYVALRN